MNAVSWFESMCSSLSRHWLSCINAIAETKIVKVLKWTIFYFVTFCHFCHLTSHWKWEVAKMKFCWPNAYPGTNLPHILPVQHRLPRGQRGGRWRASWPEVARWAEQCCSRCPEPRVSAPRPGCSCTLRHRRAKRRPPRRHFDVIRLVTASHEV